ncbi:MAG: AsmA family protein [Gammaproteobacteria bacterium]|nr:MAG: AsmA family protein [Gammaproteobacteria bacterium]
MKLHSENEMLHYVVDLSSNSQNIAKIPEIPKLGDKTISGNMESVKLSIAGQLKQLDEWLKKSRINLQAGQSKLSLRAEDKSTQDAEEINLDALSLEAVPGNSTKLKLNGKHRNTTATISLVTIGLSELTSTKKPVPVNIEATYGEFQLQADGTYDDMQTGQGAQLAIKLKGKQSQEKGQQSLKGNFSAKAQRYVLSDLSGYIGNTDLKGSVDVSTNQANPFVRADLTSNNLHYYDLVAREPEADEPDASKERKRLVPDTEIPVDLLRAYDAEIKVSAVHFFIGEIEYSDFKLQAVLKDDVLTVEPFEASMRGNAITTSLKLSVKDATPSGQLQFNTAQTDYGDLFESLGVTDKIEGLADIEISLQGQGDTVRGMVINSEGHTRIVAGEGKIREANFDLWAADLATSLVSGALTPETVTHVNCIVGHFDIKDGHASSDTLMLDTERITVAGTAKIDLIDEEIDAFIQPVPKNPSLVSLANPVKLSGDMFSPTVTVEKGKGRNWMLKGVLLGLANPATLLVMYSDLGSGEQNPCAKAVEKREAVEEKAEEEGKELEALRLPGKLLRTITSPFRSKGD